MWCARSAPRRGCGTRAAGRRSGAGSQTGGAAAVPALRRASRVAIRATRGRSRWEAAESERGVHDGGENALVVTIVSQRARGGASTEALVDAEEPVARGPRAVAV